MGVCQCESLEKVFDQREAAAQLRRARRNGPRRTTQILIEGKTLLDIGGGVGLIQQELLRSGLRSAIDVDASSAYLQTAAEEMERLGLKEKVRFVHGNFVDVAPSIPVSDLVTLDRVICCYDDLEALLTASSARARAVFALVYPRDAWWVRLVGTLLNAARRMDRDPYRFFVHATAAVEEVMRKQGLGRVFHQSVGLWQVALYAR